MLGFIVRRLISAVLVVVLTSMLVFTLFYKGPTDPAMDLCQANNRCTPSKLATLEHEMQLDLPLTTAYTRFIGGLFHSRTFGFGPAEQVECPAPCLGVSFSNKEPVTSQLIHKYPATFVLALGGALIELVLGIAIGVFTARYKGGFFDRFMVGSTLVVQAIPYYLIALMAWIFLTLKFPLFPQDAENFSITGDPLSTFHMFALPWLLIGITGAANYIRYTRGQMIEVMSDDYIRTATAKGLPSRVVLFRHSLRAAIAPVVTIFGLDLAVLLTGTIFTEQIFGIDGFGRWSILSMRSPIDFPVLTANTLLTAIVIVIANLVVDIVYGFLDPRVRIS